MGAAALIRINYQSDFGRPRLEGDIAAGLGYSFYFNSVISISTGAEWANYKSRVFAEGLSMTQQGLQG